MRIDAHVHLWERGMIPDAAVKNYLEPLKKLKELGLDDVFDFKLDEDIPFPDYNERIEDYIESMDANGLDHMVILATDFGLVNEGRTTNDEYTEWLFQFGGCGRQIIFFGRRLLGRQGQSEFLNHSKQSTKVTIFEPKRR